MICVAALSILGILGIISVKYRSLAKEAFHCVFLRVQFKPCDTGFDIKMKSKVTVRLIRFPRVAKVWRKYFQVISWIFVILMVVSFYFSTVAIYNIVRYGTCDPEDPCALISFPRRILKPFSIPSNATDSLGFNPVEIVFFYEIGCPNYDRTTNFLNQRIKPNYPVLIREYEIHELGNADLLTRLANIYNVEVNVPMIFVGDKWVKGDDRIALRKIEDAVRTALRTQAPSPLRKLEKEKEIIIKKRLTLPALVGAAAVDAVNPCAFAVITILLGAILIASKRRKRVLSAGFAFTTSTFISYLLMGFGLFSAIRIAGIQHYVYTTVAILATLIGLWNMKDYLWYGRWFKMEVPESWRPRLKKITSSVTSIPGAFGIGFLVSLFLLPCTSGPYVVIIGMLSDSSTQLQAVKLLLLYNLIFVLIAL